MSLYCICNSCTRDPTNCGFNDPDLEIGDVFNPYTGMEIRCAGYRKTEGE